MRKTVILFTILSISILLSSGCDNTSEIIIGPEIDSIKTVINMELFENLENGLRSVQLRCVTDSIFPCPDFLIEYNLSTTSNTLALTFTKISKPTLCPDGFAPAAAIVSLGVLASISYDFPITVNSLTLPAQLILTDSTIEILNGDSTWTDVVRPVLYRVPANTIWGEVGYNDPVLRDSALTFFDSLTSLGATPATLSSGHYGYFFIDNTNTIDSILELGPSIGTDSLFSYIYNYIGDTTALSNLVTAYQNQAGNLVKVNIITSDGYQFRSY